MVRRASTVRTVGQVQRRLTSLAWWRPSYLFDGSKLDNRLL